MRKLSTLAGCSWLACAALLPSVVDADTYFPPAAYGSSNAQTTASGWFNVNSTSLQKWRKAMANVRSGASRAKIVVVGDSTSAGSGAGTGGTLNQNGAFANGWVADFATLLNKYVATVFQSFWGDQAVSVGYGTYDTRVTLGANWSQNTSGLGGNMFKYTTGAVNNLTFTPTAAFDTIVVWYMKISGDGTATINVDGGASLGTINFSNSSSILTSSTFTVAAGTHTINIVPNNDATFFVVGVQTYVAGTKAVDVFQTAVNGATAATFVGGASPWQSPLALEALAPDLTVIDLTINDSNNGTSLATYISNMQTLITDAKLSGDVLLVVGPPSNTTQATNGTLDQFIAALRGLAISNNVPLLDLKTRWTSYAAANPVFPYFDSKHPEVSGYWDIGLAISEMLSAP